MTNVNNANTVLRVNSNVKKGVRKTDEPTIAVSMIPVVELVSQAVHPGRRGVNHILGAVTYGQAQSLSEGLSEGLNTKVDFPVLNVELQSLHGEPLAEVWHSEEAPEYGAAGYIRYSKNSALMFAGLELECGPDLQKQTESIYKEILSFVRDSGYPHLLRVWNHFPLINDFDHTTERYQLFCVGRHNAFQALYGTEFQLQLPAASAIGTRGSKYSVHFIASTKPGTYLENPRQISAYRYPEQYGPCSPSFARATLVSQKNKNKLILSGTASIVGHQTLHVGEPEKQLEETLRNIDALLHHDLVLAHQQNPARFNNVKIYIRHREDLPKVRSQVMEYFGDQVPLLYLHGDICRSDLLLEIEGICDL
ncbi:chorismate transformation enzyme, FkbO/Hyg5 family [Kaarinaea lacus]